MDTHSIKLAIFALLALVVAAIYWTWSRFMRVLQDDYPSDWEKLGRPSRSTITTMEQDKSTFRYLYSSEYLVHENANLNALASRTKLLTYVVILLAAALAYVDWVLE